MYPISPNTYVPVTHHTSGLNSIWSTVSAWMCVEVGAADSIAATCPGFTTYTHCDKKLYMETMLQSQCAVCVFDRP